MAPYHATAAERIAATEKRLGRKIWASRELPDPLATALWWKQRRWLFDDLRHNLHEDDRRIHEAESEYYEAAEAYRAIIERLWATRQCDRSQARMIKAANDCVEMTETLVAMARGLKETEVV